MFFDPIIASVAVALLSLIGAVWFGASARLTGSSRFILPTAVGVFLGVVFFELIPETLEASHEWGPVAIVGGFLGFYLLSRILDTFHHHHVDDHDPCNTGGAQRLLIGDAIHNFADGVVIASAFMIDPTLGVLTTVGIALHEIPQEIAEFGVLVHAGYTRRRAMLYNLLSASTVILGTIAALFFAQFLEPFMFILTGIAAGNLLYIATADIIPELRTTHRDRFMSTFVATLLGVTLIAILINYTHGEAGHGHDHEHEEHHEDGHEDDHDDDHDE